MDHFQKELNELRARSASVRIDIGPAEDVYKLRRDTEEMFKFCKDIRETTQVSYITSDS